jgi:hypothetical protein
MKSNQAPAPAIRRLVIAQSCLLMIAAASSSWAQTTQPPAAPDAATLAKYDRNSNGTLDPDERAAMDADTRNASAAGASAAVPANEETILLSPFEVSAEDQRGYYAPNTMSGTRLNAKIEDLASSITVMTKEQMQDFAMLDINDVFLYAGGTEGTGTFTDLTVDRNGSVADNVQLNPTQANRIRGMNSANVSLGNIETMNRVPLDPTGIDSVEISRGPNANVFGLGNPSGTVNLVPSSGNVTRDHTQISTRVDSYGGYRGSVDVNHVLIPDKLAVRIDGVYQHDAFVRKPSGTDTRRFDARVRFQPYKNTTINASYSVYRMDGNRPNFAPPRDNVSYWIASGMPSWDPVTETIHLNGQTLGPFTGTTPDYFTATFTGSSRSQIYTDQNGIGYWGTPTTNLPSANSPLLNGQGTVRLMASTPAAGSAGGKITRQPLFTTTPAVNNKSIYDWENINLAAPNHISDKTETYDLQINQTFFNTQRQMFAAQIEVMREDSERIARNLLGTLNDNGQSSQLSVDVNERNLDGTPNAYFGRLYIGSDQPLSVSQPATWDTYRGQLAYKLDFTHEDGALKWLGMHQLTGYYEYKYRVNRQYSTRDVMVDPHSWLAPGISRADQGGITGGPAAAPNITRGFYRFYVGDAQGNNIDFAPVAYDLGQYNFVWGGYTLASNIPVPGSGVFHTEPAVLGEADVADATGANANNKRILKTAGAILQSHFLDDRLVTTFGVRQDKTYDRFGSRPQLLEADGITIIPESVNHWQAGDWGSNRGTTHQKGGVVRPFRNLGFVRDAAAGGGAAKFFADALNGLALTYNESDSFIPQTPAQDLFFNRLPNSTGEGKDYGFWFNLADGKFVVRFNHYTTKQLNARNGDANTLAGRVLRHDVTSADAFQLHNRAFDWVSTDPAHVTWTPDQIEDEVANQIKITRDVQNNYTNPAFPLAATNDLIATGNELELNFNPTRFWTLKAEAAETKSINQNVSDTVQQYIDARMPVWTSITDPRGADHIWSTADDGPVPWWTQNYGGSQTAAQNFATFVESPYAVIKQLEGKSNPQVRKYSFRVSTNFRLSGVTENRIWKNMNIGGAVRWEDKGAIAYHGIPDANGIFRTLDSNQPIYDKSHTYLDMFIGYRTRIWEDKVAANIQLNVRNLTENGGGLQPISAYPDGTPNAYRIIDPRQFILQVTFDL